MMNLTQRELYHHGVKGQRWGVRNGPPYPIEDTVLKKGTRINSVSPTYSNSDNYMKNGKWMYTYRKDEEYDNAVYKGPFSQYLAMYRGAKFIREHEFETVKDLKMPTKNQRVAEFKDMLADPKTSKIVKDDLDKFQKILIKYEIGDEKERKAYANFNSNSIKTAEDMNTAYSIFNHCMEAVYQNKSTIEYARRMAKKYDAMVDDNNQGVYNDAHDPIIIFRADQMLKDVSDPKSPHFLTVDEIMENRKKVEEELKKQGRLVKL